MGETSHSSQFKIPCLLPRNIWYVFIATPKKIEKYNPTKIAINQVPFFGGFYKSSPKKELQPSARRFTGSRTHGGWGPLAWWSRGISAWWADGWLGVLQRIDFLWKIKNGSQANKAGWWLTSPLKNDEWKSVGMMTFPTEWKNKKCSKPPTRKHSAIFPNSRTVFMWLWMRLPPLPSVV